MKQITTSEKQTINFGKKIAKSLHGGEVILLIGDLGAGKTALVKGVAAGLGVKQTVTSPTFVLMKVYETEKVERKRETVNNIKNLVHIDTYRGLSIRDLENIGAAEYFGRNDMVCLIEWGGGLEDYLKAKKINYRKILIRSVDQNVREFIF